MFRKKSDLSEDGPRGPADDTAFRYPKPAPPRASTTRGPQIPPRPPVGAGFHPDIPQRSADIPGAPKRSEVKPSANEGKTMANSVDKNTLIVGEDIRLKGEITSCDKLVIEGHVEISLTNGRQIVIGSSGVFTGQAEVQEAEISGRFDGELTAHERLVVRSTGHITGKIRYGRIVIEAGGEIVGAVEAIASAGDAKSSGANAPKVSDQPSPAALNTSGAASAKKNAPELEMTSQRE